MGTVLIPGQGLIFMKVGVHAKESLEEIIARKKKEIDEAGFALWGYGGATCYPNTMVQPFAKECVAKGQKLMLCMQEMDSKHFAEPVRATHCSIDNRTWSEIHPAINVRGSRFAMAIKSLESEDFELPLDHTRVAIGPSTGRIGDKYIQGRADKGCFELTSGLVSGGPVDSLSKVRISLVAELCEPYAVFLKNPPQ